MNARGRIFLLDDDDLIVDMLARALRSERYDVRAETDPDGVVERIRAFSPDVTLLDNKLPGTTGIEILQEITARGIETQVVMLTSDDTADTAVRAMKLGAVDYLTKPFDLDEVKLVIRGIVEKGVLRREVDYLRKVSRDILDKEIVGASRAIRGLKEKAAKLAAAGVPTVLVTGESGTGKEVFARYIHNLMHGGADGGYAPFVGINCAALPEHLVESELFGYEKGAFTDAKGDKKGVFELAHGGSILLDEITEMRPALQSKFLRVLEDRTVRRIGGKDDIPIAATVFATTNRDLTESVEKGEFRMDLYYRLNAFSLVIPPLRERTEDIPAFARHFLDHFAVKYGKKGFKGIAPAAEKLLLGYRWPGNVRELRNAMERIVVLEGDGDVLPEHLPAEVLARGAFPREDRPGGVLLPDAGFSLDAVEKDLIRQALAKTGSNKTAAAKLLGVTYDSLRYQIKKFGLE